MEKRRYLKFKEAEKFFGLSKSSIYRLMKRGFPYIQHRSIIRFPQSKCETWLFENQIKRNE